MSGPPAPQGSWIKLALRMLWNILRESVQDKGRALRAGMAGAGFRFRKAHSELKMLDRTTWKGVECAAPVAYRQEALAGASGEESRNGSSRWDYRVHAFPRRQSGVERRDRSLLTPPITFTVP